MSTIVRSLPRRVSRRATPRGRTRAPYPLDVVYAQAGIEPPRTRPVAPERIPGPYHSLLVHERDMGGDDEALRELTAFFDTLTFTPAASAGTPWGVPAPGAAGLVGRWWKVASTAGGDRYYWYEFTDKGSYSYETPFQERQAGTFRVQENRITLTTTTGRATSRVFAFECVGSKLRLEFRDENTGAGDGYWSEKSC